MVDIRIKDLPLGTPNASKLLAMDLTTTERATIKDIVYAGRPAASQADAEAGTDADKAMTALATNQAINFKAVLQSQAGSVGLNVLAAASQSAARAAIGVDTSSFVSYVIGLALGATPDIIAANTATLQAAFDALPSTGGKIVFPAGYYFFYTGSLIIPAVPVTIVGCGMDVTTLVFFGAPGWSGRSAGFYFPNTVNGVDRINMPISISDMTFWAADASCGSAIDLRYKTPGIYKAQSIERVRFVSATTANGDPFSPSDRAIRWNFGVDLTNAIHGHIRDCYFAGANQSVLPNSGLLDPMVAAVVYRGNSNKQSFEDSACIFIDTGVLADPNAYAEAMKVDKCTFGLCNWGVYLPYTAPLDAPRVMTISDNDFETIKGGIFGTKRHEWDISENKIWKRGESTANWVGIFLDNCERTDVSRNKIWGRVPGVAGGNSIAIIMANCDGSGIEDNHFGTNFGVDFANSGSGIAHHNRWDDGSINTIPGAYVTPFTNKPAAWTWESNNAGYPTSYVE